MDNEKGLKFGFIGVGQCGGNIANEFAKLGYKAIAINTSQTDLIKLDNIQKNNRLLIPLGIQGAGKNPEVGRAALEEHIEPVMRLIDQVFGSEMDMLFVSAGLGGGTGSGIAPLLTQILCEQGNQVGVIVTLPSDIESPKVKIVALNAFEELSQIEGIGSVLVVDNAKATKLPAQMGFKTKYGVVNENVATKLDQMNIMTMMASEVAFDARDFLTLLTSRGCTIITSAPIDDVANIRETEFLAQIAVKSLDNGIYASTDFMHAKGCAFLFELPEGGAAYLTEDALAKMQKEMGTPFEVFTGVYEAKTRKRDAVLNLIISGLPFPTERLNRMQAELENQADNIQNLIASSQQQRFEGSGKSLLGKFVSGGQPKPTKSDGDSTLDRLLKKKKN